MAAFSLVNREAVQDGLHRRLVWACLGYAAVMLALGLSLKAGFLLYRGDLLAIQIACIGALPLVGGGMHLFRPLDWVLLPAAGLLALLPFLPTFQWELSVWLGRDLVGVKSLALAAPAAALLWSRALWAGLLGHVGYRF